MARQTRNKERQKSDAPSISDWRRPLRWGLYGLSVVLMIFAGKLGVEKLQDPAILPLSVVRIDGDFKYLSRSDLEQAVGVVVTGNFFSIDLEAVKQAAYELEWVEQVTVRRVWPDTIEMVVVEQEPLAYWGKRRLISTKGVIFAPTAFNVPINLPRLGGPDPSAEVVTNNFYKYSHRMSQLNLKITQLVADSRMAWSIVFEDGMELKLGKDRPRERLEKFASLYRLLNKTTERALKKIDLRYSNGAAVVWGEIVEPTKTKAKKVTKLITDIQNEPANYVGRGHV